MGRPIKFGSTDQSTIIRIVNATTGAPETGVTSATSGLDLIYRRDGAAPVSITETTLPSPSAAHADGGIVHIFSGYYRLDLPDAACLPGSTGVLVAGECSGMLVIGEYHQLVSNFAEDVYDRVGQAEGASLAADVAAIKAIVDAILQDTGSTLDGKINTIDMIVDAIKAKTDGLTFTIAGRVDSNVRNVNSVAVGGAGVEGNPWGPA